MSKEEVLNLYISLGNKIPVDWSSKESIAEFKNTASYYSKQWSRLSSEDQGWVCEKISEGKHLIITEYTNGEMDKKIL